MHGKATRVGLRRTLDSLFKSAAVIFLRARQAGFCGESEAMKVILLFIHLTRKHFYICFLIGLQIPNWDRVESFSNKKESRTRASTSLHVYFMLSDSCTVFLHLYKSIFLPLPSRTSEQCSLWLSGSIKVCQMNRKNHARRGNEKLSKATWNLKHYFSFFLFPFFFFLLSFHLASQAWTVQGFPPRGCANACVCVL